MSLYYLVNWGGHRERAWSGSCLSLFDVLRSRTVVTDLDLSYAPVRDTLWKRLCRKRYSAEDPMWLDAIGRYRRYVKGLLPRKGDFSVLQFEEVMYDRKHCHTYIYQDLSVSYVKYLHDTNPEIFRLSGFSCDGIEKALAVREKRQNDYYRTCSGIFTMGRWIREDLVGRCGVPGEKVHHVGGGINLDPGLVCHGAPSGRRILFVGRDFRRKGGYLVYDAFRILRARKPDVELYVAGPELDPVAEPVEGYHFMGPCDYRTVSGLFNMCDIFCMPSFFEAYGLVFIEALAYGLPCIGRNAYEMPYLIEDGETGYLLPENIGQDGAAAELADMMESLLADRRMANNVRERRDWYLKEYSWDTVASRMLGVLDMK